MLSFIFGVNMPRADTPKTYTVLTGYIKRETDKAVLFECTDNSELSNTEKWYPISQLKSIHRMRGNEPDSIEVADWLVQAKIEEGN